MKNMRIHFFILLLSTTLTSRVYSCKTIVNLFKDFHSPLLKAAPQSPIVLEIVSYLFEESEEPVAVELLNRIEQQTNIDFAIALEGLRVEIKKNNLKSYADVDNHFVEKAVPITKAILSLSGEQSTSAKQLNPYREITDFYDTSHAFV